MCPVLLSASIQPSVPVREGAICQKITLSKEEGSLERDQRKRNNFLTHKKYHPPHPLPWKGDNLPIQHIEWYGGLNKNGPHRLRYLNAWIIRSGTIRRCGIVGVGVALLEEVQVTVGMGFEVSYAQIWPMWHSLLLQPMNQDTELSAPSTYHAPYHDNNELNL
jgi:hypothetical protein